MHPSNAIVKATCRAILAGDLELARAELGLPYSLRVAHCRAISGSLRAAAMRYNAPHLADYSPFTLE